MEQNPIPLSLTCTDEDCHVSLNIKFILIKIVYKSERYFKTPMKHTSVLMSN